MSNWLGVVVVFGVMRYILFVGVRVADGNIEIGFGYVNLLMSIDFELESILWCIGVGGVSDVVYFDFIIGMICVDVYWLG